MVEAKEGDGAAEIVVVDQSIALAQSGPENIQKIKKI